MTKINLSVDTGYSDTKVSYQIAEENRMRYFLMSPKIANITQTKLDNYREQKGWLGSPIPERQAWLELAEKKIIAVGSLADEFDSIYSRAKPEQPKYESALYKVLVAIGVVIQKHQLSSRAKIKLNLAVLLPCNEYSDRHRFEQALSKVCSSYKFRGQTLKVKIDKFVCRPEGGGLAMARMNLNGGDWFRRQRLGILMLGSRNLTGLYFEYGELKVSESPLMGFSYLVNDIVKQTSGLTAERITEAIFLGLRTIRPKASDQNGCERPFWSELEAIKNLATARDLNLWREEVDYIAEVIEKVALDWEDKLKTWLRDIFPANLTEISISGGSVPFFALMLEQHFNCLIYSEKPKPLFYRECQFVPIYLGAGIVLQVEKALQLNKMESNKQALSFRLIDCCAVLDDLIDINLEEKELESAKAV